MYIPQGMGRGIGDSPKLSHALLTRFSLWKFLAFCPGKSTRNQSLAKTTLQSITSIQHLGPMRMDPVKKVSHLPTSWTIETEMVNF